MSDGAVGVLILFLTIVLLPIFFREFRSSARLIVAYWFVIALHFGVAFADTLLFMHPAGETDSRFFHRDTVSLGQSGNFLFFTNEKLYQSVLGVLYWIFEPSLLLGSQLSILMFAISCVILIKILGLLELSRYKVSVILAFGALPSMVFFSSVTLRESYQVLFFMLATYFGLRMLIERNIRVWGIFMVVPALIMGMFHNGLMVFAVYLIALFMGWNIYSTSGWLVLRREYLLRVFVVLTLILSTIFLTKSQYAELGILSSIVNIDILEQMVVFQSRNSATVTRATYDTFLDSSSPFRIVYTSFVLYLNGLFAPFPWQVENVRDVVGSLEGILRMVLIGFSLKHLCRAHGAQFRLLLLMFILFFSMSFMWAMGTTNYGTAMRHNLVSWWILAITGTPLLMERLSRIGLEAALRRCMHFLRQAKKIY